MKLFITDTNVFFDLMNIEALPEFFGLDFEVCTTDFVVSEILRLEQAEQIQSFIRSKQLTIFSFSADEIDEIVHLKTKRVLRRIADKSVLWKALHNMELQCSYNHTNFIELKNVNGKIALIMTVYNIRHCTPILGIAKLINKFKN